MSTLLDEIYYCANNNLPFPPSWRTQLNVMGEAFDQFETQMPEFLVPFYEAWAEANHDLDSIERKTLFFTGFRLGFELAQFTTA